MVEKRPICLAQICPAWLVSFIVDRRGPLERRWRRPREKAHSSTAAAHPRASMASKLSSLTAQSISKGLMQHTKQSAQSRGRCCAATRALIISALHHGPVRPQQRFQQQRQRTAHTAPPAPMPFLFFSLRHLSFKNLNAAVPARKNIDGAPNFSSSEKEKRKKGSGGFILILSSLLLLFLHSHVLLFFLSLSFYIELRQLFTARCSAHFWVAGNSPSVLPLEKHLSREKLLQHILHFCKCLLVWK